MTQVPVSQTQTKSMFITRKFYTTDPKLPLIPVFSVIKEHDGRPVIHWRLANDTHRAIAISQENYCRFLEIGQKMRVLPILLTKETARARVWNVVEPSEDLVLDMIAHFDTKIMIPEIIARMGYKVFIHEPQIRFLVAKNGKKLAIDWNANVSEIGVADDTTPYVEARAFYYVVVLAKTKSVKENLFDGSSLTVLTTPVAPMTSEEVRKSIIVVLGEVVAKRSGRRTLLGIAVPQTWETIRGLSVAFAE